MCSGDRRVSYSYERGGPAGWGCTSPKEVLERIALSFQKIRFVMADEDGVLIFASIDKRQFQTTFMEIFRSHLRPSVLLRRCVALLSTLFAFAWKCQLKGLLSETREKLSMVSQENSGLKQQVSSPF